jgi:hypothetical protein
MSTIVGNQKHWERQRQSDFAEYQLEFPALPGGNENLTTTYINPNLSKKWKRLESKRQTRLNEFSRIISAEIDRLPNSVNTNVFMSDEGRRRA